MIKIFKILIICTVLISCSLSNAVTREINKNFNWKYPEIKEYSRTRYQEKLRKRVISEFLRDFKNENGKLYIIERFQNRGGHHVASKYQTVMNYFWQNNKLIEVYHVDDRNKLEAKNEQYWGTAHVLPTLKFIQEKLNLNQIDSIEIESKNIKNQFSHPGEFFITELNEELNVINVVKCIEFRID